MCPFGLVHLVSILITLFLSQPELRPASDQNAPPSPSTGSSELAVTLKPAAHIARYPDTSGKPLDSTTVTVFRSNPSGAVASLHLARETGSRFMSPSDPASAAFLSNPVK